MATNLDDKIKVSLNANKKKQQFKLFSPSIYDILAEGKERGK